MKKNYSETFSQQVYKFFVWLMYISVISPQDQEISRKLIQKLGLIFNFRGGYKMKKINSITFFTPTLIFVVLHINICAAYLLRIKRYLKS